MKNCLSRIFLILLSFTASTRSYAQAVAGSMAGAPCVSSSGAFTYSIPLALPPGIKNIMPQLAINYNSQAGNGLLGMGWGLSGFSAISRTSMDIYHHGKVEPFSFSIGDVFELDGSKLVETSPSNYECFVKNFSRITSTGSVGSGPDHFIVEGRDGLIYEYGNSGDSKFAIMAPSMSVGEVYTWALNKVSDRSGNYMEFIYYNDPVTHESNILKIRYAGNAAAGAACQTEIDFSYITRFDANFRSIAGGSVNSLYLLDKIEIKHLGSIVHTYDMTYGFDFYSHLTSLTEIGQSGATLPQTDFVYGNTPPVPATTTSATTLLHDPGYAPCIADINGDGYSDLVNAIVVDPTPSGSTPPPHPLALGSAPVGSVPSNKVYMNNHADNFNYTGSVYSPFLSTTIGYHIGSPTRYSTRIDYNGDGKEDVLTIAYNNSDYYVYVCLANPSGTGLLAPSQILHAVVFSGGGPLFFAQTKVAIGDFIGNGKTQVLVFLPSGSTTGPSKLYNPYLLGDGFAWFFGFFTGEVDDFAAIDLDGDGKSELFMTMAGGIGNRIYTIHSTCTPSGVPVTPTPPLLPTLFGVTIGVLPDEFNSIYYGDFNGDGKTDLLTWKFMPFSGWNIYYSDGKFGYGPAAAAPPGLNNADPDLSVTDNNIIVGDFNGDGKDDIFEMDGGAFKVHYSEGGFNFHTEPVTFSAPSIDERLFSTGDFNGDGQTDILYSSPASLGTAQIIYFYKDDQRHLLTKVKKNDNLVPAQGQEFSISYKSLPQTNHGMATHGVAYPFTEIYPGNIKVAQTLDNNKFPNMSYYNYNGLVVHKLGLSGRGFESFGMYDMTGASLQQNNWWDYETVVPVETDVTRFGTIVASAWPPNCSKTLFEFGEDVLLPNNIHVLYPKSTVKEDYVNNLRNEVTYTYLPGSNAKRDYGKPDKVTTDVGYGTEVTEQNITYSVGDPHFYNQDEPATVMVTSTRTGQPAIARTTDFTYNAQGLLDTKTEDPGGAHTHTMSYFYDGFGNIQTETSTTGTSSVSNNFVSTSDGRFVAQRALPLGHVENFSFDTWGNVTSATDINGVICTSTFDDFARKITSSKLGVTCSTAYHWANGTPDCPSTGSLRLAIENMTVGITGSSVDFYDYNGNVTRSVNTAFDGSKSYTDKEYDGTGRLLVKASRPYASTASPAFTLHGYDGFDRLVSEISPICSLTHVYSLTGTTLAPLSGMVVTSTNTSALPVRSSAKTIDAAGRTTQIEDAGGISVLTYSYNSAGQVLQTVANGQTTDYTYDAYGNLLTTAAPNNTVTCTYDDRDRVQTSTDGNGVTFSFAYDALNRVVSKTDAGSGTIFGYNYGTSVGTLGKLTSETYSVGGSPVSSTNYGFDASARLTSKTEVISGSPFTSTYTYDAFSRPDETTFPSGDVIKNEYNVYGYHSGIWALGYATPPYYPSTPIWRKNAENALGQTTSTSMAPDMSIVIPFLWGLPPLSSLPMLLYDTTAYSANGFLITDDVSTWASTLKHDAYVFDEPTGDLLSHSNSMHTELFTYDNLDRMTSATTIGGPVQNMIYLANGNIAQKSDISSSDWSYDKYAVVGLPTPSVVPTFTQSATYTPFNKVATLHEFTSPNKRIEFTYKPDEQRGMAKYYSGPGLQKTRYYAENYEKTVTAGTGAVREISYVMAEGKPVAMFVRNGGAPQLRYLLTNYQGSITHVMDETGGLIEERSYDPWGRPRNPTTWDYTSIPPYVYDRGYTGQEHLADFNVINLNGRLYDPMIARMFSPDPYITDPDNAQTYNSYSYCHNNPMKYTDKDGEWAHIVIGAAIGGVLNLASNWGNINNFGEGLAAFGAGAASGALTATLGPVGATLGAAITGATNNVIAQTGNGVGLRDVNWGTVGLNAGVGAVAGIASYGAANWATNNISNAFLSGIASPMLRGGIKGAVGGVFGGAAGGFVAGVALSGGSLAAGGRGAFTGSMAGLVVGGSVGVMGGYFEAKAAQQNPLTGRSKLSTRFVVDEGGGVMDLEPTMDRIDAGQKLNHRNDGSTFQNKEGRLPQQPLGNYKEYVHPNPTPNSKFPGTMRMIKGSDGQMWFSTDHYKTFIKVR